MKHYVDTNVTIETVPVNKVQDDFVKFCSSHYACGGCKYYNPSRNNKDKDIMCEMLFVRDHFYLIKKEGE